MSGDLISRNALLRSISHLSKVDNLTEEFVPAALTMFHAVAYYIQGAPAVDAVEVVRCRDCKYHAWDDDVDYVCLLTGKYTGFEDFCSYGERKDNGV